MNIEFDVSDFLVRTGQLEKAAVEAGRRGVQRSMTDLKRISVEIAPIDTGNLRRSAKYRTWIGDGEVVGEVTFSATSESPKYGRFNYALWTHEYMAHARATGGTDGYAIGNKYLERPLYGESEKYLRWISEELEKAIGGR